MLLLEFNPVRCLDLSLLAATYNRCDRRGGNVSSLMTTCVVPHTLHCERVCTMTSGCKSFFYSPRTSTCRFHSDDFKGQSDETDQNNVSQHDRYYYREQGDLSNAKSEPFTRILFGPDLYRGKIFKQLHMQSRQTKLYSFLRSPDKISSIAYLSISRTFLISFTRPDTIWRAPVDSSNNWTFVLNDSATNMGVDESRRLLIFTGIHKGKHYLGKLHLECNHLQKINENNRFDGLAVFPGRQLICAGGRDKILFVDYDGEVISVLKTKPRTCIASNPSLGTDHVLYYSEHSHIIQMSLPKNGIIRIARIKVVGLRQSPSTLIYDGNKTLYAAVYGGFLTIDVLKRKVGYTVATQNPRIRMLVLL